LLESTECELDAGPSRIRRLAQWAMGRYDTLLHWRWFRRAVLLVFVGQAALGTLATLSVADVVQASSRLDMSPMESLAIASVATSLVSLLLVVVGMIYLPHRRLTAYHWFERSLVVAILVTQVMLFWQSQLAALGGLFWSLTLLVVVRS